MVQWEGAPSEGRGFGGGLGKGYWGGVMGGSNAASGLAAGGLADQPVLQAGGRRAVLPGLLPSAVYDSSAASTAELRKHPGLKADEEAELEALRRRVGEREADKPGRPPR